MNTLSRPGGQCGGKDKEHSGSWQDNPGREYGSIT
jgi:hypothetical protein